MLYEMREAQRAVLTPLSDWAGSMSKLYVNQYSPLSILPFARRLSAGFELLHRLGKEYEKPEFGIRSTRIDDQEVTVAERIELSKPFCRLLKFDRMLPKALSHHHDDPKILVFAPLSGHHATLLRDTVRALLPDHEVYITDWIDARMVPLSDGSFHLDDYIAYAIEFTRHLGPDVHLLSVCQPTVPVLAAVSLMATLKDENQPLTMTMMGGPIDTRQSPTEVNNLATTHTHAWFENNVIHTVPVKYPGVGRRVYPGFLQHAGFVAMNPDRHLNSHWGYYQDLVRGIDESTEGHRKFYNEYNAVLDMAAEYYLDTIATVFQEHRLPRGVWDVRLDGRSIRVAPEDIRGTALFTIEGELDDISGPGQTQAAHALCRNIPNEHRQHLTAPRVGHYGIFSGRRWRERIYPQLRDFIRAHPQRIGRHLNAVA